MGNYLGVPEASHNSPLQDVEREATLNPLHANIVFERLSSAAETSNSADNDENEGDTKAKDPKLKGDRDPTEEKDFTEENEPSQDASCSIQGSGRGVEQIMRVSVQIPHQFHSHIKLSEDRCHVIVVADCSGSMAGNPWNQVKGALVDMVSTNLAERSSTVVDVVTYNNKAKLVKYRPDDYTTVLGALKAGGLTSFVAAMDRVDDVMKNRKGERFVSTAVMFMTDGQDSVSSKHAVNQRIERWKTTLQASPHLVTVHAVGFSKDHDFKFLQSLSEVGSRPGLFRYCEPGDGPEGLKMKVQELFDYAVHSAGQTVEVTVEMEGDSRIVTPSGGLLPTHTVEGEIINADQRNGEGTEDAGAAEMTVQAEMWVVVPEAAELPSPVVSLSKTVVSNGQRQKVKLPCVCDGVEGRVVDDAGSKALWGLNVLSRNTDALAEQIANAIQEKKDVTSLQTRLSRLQSRLSNTKVFGRQISSDVRASLLSTMKEIQAKMDTMHGMMARYSRGETASVSILARAHDLRYEAQFKKSRRQRLMDQRAVKNVHQAKADEAKLENLTVDEAELSRLSQEAVGFFFCTLSQESVVDVLRDLDNKENAIGFGLAVCRPEYIVDSPTLLQLCLVSGTLVSRSSMLDALEFKVNLSGQLSAHNGFSFFRSGDGGDGDGSMGYATVGLGREPINAWMPLYITKSHWERVKVILKPSLGYLCTLDPLGFDWGQLDVPFAVLGAMIGHLTPATTGAHQLKLLFSFLRTCVALVEDFNLTNRILNVVRTFLREPKGRFKSVIPNLHTLIGYIAALPVSQSRKILGYDEEGRDPEQLPRALWLAFLAEMLRRSGGSTLKSHSDRQRNILVDFLLHGRKNSLMLPGKAQEASCVASTQQTPPTTTSTATAGTVQEASCLTTGQQTSTTAATTTGTAQETSNTAATTGQTSTTTTNTAAEKVQEATCSANATVSTATPAAAQAREDAAQHTAARFTILCSSMATNQDADLTIQGVDEDADSKGEQQGNDAKGEKAAEAAAKAAVEFPHCPKTDSHMEMWARAELGGLENKSQEKKVSSAKKQVALWLKEGRQAAGLSEEEAAADTQEEELDCDAVDSSMLEVTTKLLTVLSRSSHLPLSSVPGAMAFLHAWMSRERDMEQMADGLPPELWVDQIKAAVARIYSDMHDYMAQCQQQISSDSVEEVLVVEGASETEGATSGRRHRHRPGKRGVDDADDDDDDDYSDDEDYAHLEEDDPMKVLKRRQEEHRSLVTLPMLLHALDPCLSKVKVVRSMLCQAVVQGPNTAAKDAVEEGQFVDLKEPDGVEELMSKLHRHLVRVSTVDQTDSILWRRANVSLLAATVWAFLGYLMNTYKERHDGFSWLLLEISELDEGSSSNIPCLADKVKVMLTGRWQGHLVLSRGNSIMPGKGLSKKLEKVLGELPWGEIDMELRGDLSIHVYRESDLPNRHGHCNSNPYIPPALRLKLGLPPLPAGAKK